MALVNRLVCLRRAAVVSVVCAFSQLGCATMLAANSIKIERPGQLDAHVEEQLEDEAESLDWHKDYDILVLRGTLPKGVELDDKGKPKHIGKLASGIKYLGAVESRADSSFFAGAFWYVDAHPSEGAARDIYCKAQTPLRLLSLGLWNFVPIAWPCHVRISVGEDAVGYHVQELKRAAKVIGGNVVVVVGSTARVATQDGVEVGRVENQSLHGLVFRMANAASGRR